MKRLLLLSFLLNSSILLAGKSITVNSERLIKVIGPVGRPILEQADKVRALTEENKKDIFVLLNSPGGSVFTGNMFIEAIKGAQAAGIKVKCISAVFAASMAFNIMLQCDERYVLEETGLLFHPVRIGQAQNITAKDALEMAKHMQEIDNRLLTALYKKLAPMTKEEIDKHYYAETFWRAADLALATKGFFTIVTQVVGIKKLFQVEPDRPARHKGEEKKKEDTK